MDQAKAGQLDIGPAAAPAGAPPAPRARLLAANVWRYIDRQLPPMQAVALCIVTLASYALFGRIGHTTPWGWEVAAAAATVVLLFLQVRLIEDVDAHVVGGELIANLGRRRELERDPAARVVMGDGRVVPLPRTLVVGISLTTAAIVLLNAWISRDAVIAALVPTATSLICVSLLGVRTLPRGLGVIPFFEVVPAMIFTYVYFVWSAVADAHISAGSVALVIGLWWLNWQFWKFSRGIGKYDIERIYGLRLDGTRVVLVVLLAALLGVAVALYSVADLSAIYLGYVAVVVATFLVSVVTLARWSGEGQPWWADLALPNAIVLGTVVQLIALLT